MQTKRTTVQRLAERGEYERETIHGILDEGLVCHVGVVADGQPFVIPMSYARVGDRKATEVLELPIAEASAKVRTGPPGESKRDVDPGVWAGVIPLRVRADAAVPDALTDEGLPLPEYARDYFSTRRPATGGGGGDSDGGDR